MAPGPAGTGTPAAATTLPGGAATPSPNATVATTAPVPTVPEVVTTVPEVTTTTPAPTTTLPPAPAPTTVTIGDGCSFVPASLTRPQGSVVRFENRSSVTVTVSGSGPPGTADAFSSLEPGGSSGPYVLTAAGTYTFSCQGAGTGRMAVTAT